MRDLLLSVLADPQASSSWVADAWKAMDDYVHMIEAVGVVVGGVLSFRQWVAKPLNRRIDSLQEDITEVKNEVKTNGGSSLKDAVNTIKNQSIPEMKANLSREVSAVRTEVTRAHDRIDRALADRADH